MPYCSQPRRNASLWNSGALSRWIARGLPIGLDPEPFQPRPLVCDRVSQAEPHRGGRRGFQGHDHPDDTATEDVDGEGEVGASDGLARRFIDHDQVNGGVIDLDEVERPLGLRGHAGGRFQGARGLVPLSSADYRHRIVFRAGGRTPAWRQRRATSRVRAASDCLGRAR